MGHDFLGRFSGGFREQIHTEHSKRKFVLHSPKAIDTPLFHEKLEELYYVNSIFNTRIQ